MSRVRDDVKINEMSIPGTHESCALYGGEETYCQGEDLWWQLNAGVRYVDIRCRVWGDIYTIHHGPVYQNMVFGTVLEDCADFLESNPTEAILMRIQKEDSDDASPQDFKRIFDKYLHEKGWGSLFCISDSFPTLGEARGKIVPMSGWPWLEEGLRLSGNDFIIQDDYDNPSVEHKKQVIEVEFARAMTERTGHLYLNHTSANGDPFYTPWWFAERLNSFTLDLLQKHYGQDGCTGVIAMDFVDCPGYKDWDWRGRSELIAAVMRMNKFKTPTLKVGREYVIWNKQSGKALDVSGGQNVQKLIQFTYNGNANQTWKLLQGYNSRTYYLQDAYGLKLRCGANSVADVGGDADQYWQIIPGPDGAFKLLQDYTGQYLFSPDGPERAEGQPVVTRRMPNVKVGGDYEWYFDEVGPTYVPSGEAQAIKSLLDNMGPGPVKRPGSSGSDFRY